MMLLFQDKAENPNPGILHDGRATKKLLWECCERKEEYVKKPPPCAGITLVRFNGYYLSPRTGFTGPGAPRESEYPEQN